MRVIPGALAGAALAALVTGVLAPSSRAACEGMPWPPDQNVPAQINLVGIAGGVADPRGEFTISIRDLAHNPISGCEVVVDFGNCWGIRIAEDQPWPGLSVVCASAAAAVSGITDENGIVTMRIVGGSVNSASGTPANDFNCAVVSVNGTLLRNVNVGAFDQNGVGGVTPADVSVWLADSFDPDVEGRSDYNGTNSVTPADLSLLLGVALGGGSTQSATAYCD